MSKKNKTYQIPPPFTRHSVGLHLAQPDHAGGKELKIKVLDFVNLHPASQQVKTIRLKVDKKWIHKLRMPEPHQMKMMDK